MADHDDSNPPQWNVGYQYMGGIAWWYNRVFPKGAPLRSPTKLSRAKPTWVLADIVCKNPGSGVALPWGDVVSPTQSTASRTRKPKRRIRSKWRICCRS